MQTERQQYCAKELAYWWLLHISSTSSAQTLNTLSEVTTCTLYKDGRHIPQTAGMKAPKTKHTILKLKKLRSSVNDMYHHKKRTSSFENSVLTYFPHSLRPAHVYIIFTAWKISSLLSFIPASEVPAVLLASLMTPLALSTLSSLTMHCDTNGKKIRCAIRGFNFVIIK